jgi:hypothetical protein
VLSIDANCEKSSIKQFVNTFLLCWCSWLQRKHLPPPYRPIPWSRSYVHVLYLHGETIVFTILVLFKFTYKEPNVMVREKYKSHNASTLKSISAPLVPNYVHIHFSCVCNCYWLGSMLGNLVQLLVNKVTNSADFKHKFTLELLKIEHQELGNKK